MILVLAPNYRHFVLWCQKNGLQRDRQAKFIYEPYQLNGRYDADIVLLNGGPDYGPKYSELMALVQYLEATHDCTVRKEYT
jgi:hypothetical protein